MMDSAYQKTDRIFHPRSIAVIGASNRPGNTAGMFLKAQRALGYQGPIYAVAPTGDEIPDFPSFRSLNDIPGPVDHVIIAVPAVYLPEVISDCARKKVRSVAIFTSGSFCFLGSVGVIIPFAITSAPEGSGGKSTTFVSSPIVILPASVKSQRRSGLRLSIRG